LLERESLEWTLNSYWRDTHFQFVTGGLAVFSNSSTPKKKLKRELWEQPFQACTIDADCAVKMDGQNSVI